MLVIMMLQMAWADCPSDSLSVSRQASETLALYSAFQVEAFNQAATTLKEMVVCLNEPLSPVQAAEIHRIYALASFVAEEAKAQQFSWRGSVALQPGYILPEDLAPQGSRIHSMYESARMLGAGQEMRVDVEGLLVDGSPSDAIPTERASVVQRPVSDGWQNAYIYGELPNWEPIKTPAVASPSRGLSRKMLIGGGVTGVGAVAGLTTALVMKNRYFESETAAEGQPLLTKNRVLGFSGYTMTATTIGLTAGAFIVGDW